MEIRSAGTEPANAINASGIPVVAYSGPGGGFCIEASNTIDRRILGFGPGLEILEPAHLREDLASTATGIAAANAAMEGNRGKNG